MMILMPTERLLPSSPDGVVVVCDVSGWPRTRTWSWKSQEDARAGSETARTVLNSSSALLIFTRPIRPRCGWISVPAAAGKVPFGDGWSNASTVYTERRNATPSTMSGSESRALSSAPPSVWMRPMQLEDCGGWKRVGERRLVCVEGAGVFRVKSGLHEMFASGNVG
jgi:hypothetical protein